MFFLDEIIVCIKNLGAVPKPYATQLVEYSEDPSILQ